MKNDKDPIERFRQLVSILNFEWADEAKQRITRNLEFNKDGLA